MSLSNDNCDLQGSIDQWLMSVEERFVLGTPGEKSTTIRGDEFVELISYKDGEFIFKVRSTRYDTPEKAWENLRKSFELYATGKEGKLYWRILPEIAYCRDEDFYRGYMRLFIEEDQF